MAISKDSKEFKRNSSGYVDPTAYAAIKNIDADNERFQKLLTAIFTICDLAGFHHEGRIVVKDKRTGKIWR